MVKAVDGITYDLPQPFIVIAKVAGQPITYIGLSAPATDDKLTRVVMTYTGSHSAIADFLRERFGATYSDATANEENSWTHARRMAWQDGPYRAGLSNKPPVISMTRDPGSGRPVD